MHYVVCRVGDDTYALEAGTVDKVLPYAALKPLPGAVRGLVGVLNYQGQSVPVVDLGLLFQGVPTPEAFGSRIILSQVAGLRSGRLGILVGCVEGISVVPEESFISPGASADPSLGDVSPAGGSFIQRIELPSVLPDDVLESLDWCEAGEAAWA
ncbi:MAG: hypothetical protein BGO12_06970 [Verrucomicrobia bacterium 61-8]|nr:chemotaxis protein CheW [Verrucomicrobiota bacterium]OJV01391.1 MAG: hypothetical protein BGO12_06970 [Verrucomicrobia bacterium 61-8]